jgi:hypothetical protein
MQLVYEDGKVCISILHPPGEDAFNEFVSENHCHAHEGNKLLIC